jgi:hypothetical protein
MGPTAATTRAAAPNLRLCSELVGPAAVVVCAAKIDYWFIYVGSQIPFHLTIP